MTRNEVADKAGVDYKEVEKNLDELCHEGLARRKVVKYRYGRIE
ncbi:hypothetical protein ACFL4C_00785 [Candidatus Omnitrophota bacterium]